MAADWTRRTLLTATGFAAAAPALASARKVIPIWPNGPPAGRDHRLPIREAETAKAHRG